MAFSDERVIREAGIADIGIIRAIAHATWPVAYHPHILSAGQLAYMLELLYSEEALAKAVRSGQRFLLFEQGVGPIAFSGFTHHASDTHTTHLNKLYVLPTVQGSGAGKLLLEHTMELAAASGDTRMTLNVNKHNAAIRFYEHMGFRIEREEVIDIGGGHVMDDYVMVRSFEDTA